MPSRRAKMPAQGIRGVHVQKLSVASVVIAAVAFSVPARAADMAPIPVSPIPIALPFDWEGFYVGVHTGAATDDVSFTQTNVSWSARQTVWAPAFPDTQRQYRRVRHAARDQCDRWPAGRVQLGASRTLSVRPRGRYLRDRHQLHSADEPAGRSLRGSSVERQGERFWYGPRAAWLHRRPLAVLHHRRLRLGVGQVHADPADGAAHGRLPLHRPQRAARWRRGDGDASARRLDRGGGGRMGIRAHLDGEARISAHRYPVRALVRRAFQLRS